ncbi:uncharacterized protein LOC102678178 [Apis dorsata]|uniref:uncharacterized protein LOC102678178 n=1 Tax=Apis dorsata TaxID=7462 RepID=UPI0003DF6213|nr:uncharacterized protein LOC102678178 [Apis dorsata]
MFSLRQIIRCGMQLTLTKEFTNLHQISLIRKRKFNVDLHDSIFIRTKTNLPESLEKEEVNKDANKKVLGKIQAKIKVMFTCKKCNFRNGKIISKLAYEKGLVIIRCDGCKNNHLIADNLGWFEELKNKQNIEKLLAAKGETVRKVLNDVDGYIEVVAKAEFDLIQHNKERKQRLIEEQEDIHNKNKKVTSSKELE